ncbi:hypothetical protein [Streptomyces xanthophaeus]|uniref:Uncharacterized protein n=1 Tax=Streptomyces xanthophaeus TaxID=67385 RepID=A0A919H0R6_9ACTN|nr:hypothetical protein [Streptomyces xanthophaeus]GHI88195.1 hypothetical protein Sxan_55590 [Streptomyces xanthophaeus]
MRKALTVSAIVLASSMALGGAATTAFAADAPTPTPTSSPSSSPAPHTAPAGLKLSTATAKPGDSVQFQMEVPDGSTNLSVSSKALNDVKMTDGRGGTAKVAEVPDGSYGISLTGTGPDGAKLQATAQLSVKAAPQPAPQAPSLNLSTDFGHPGDKVVVTIRTTEKNAYVRSDAFGGQVNLKSDGKGTWTGTAIVAKDVKTGYYGVQAFAGGKQFDTVKFSTEATGGKDVKPHTDPRVKPLKPSEHKKPQGSVNTGQAPAGSPADA